MFVSMFIPILNPNLPFQISQIKKKKKKIYILFIGKPKVQFNKNKERKKLFCSAWFNKKLYIN